MQFQWKRPITKGLQNMSSMVTAIHIMGTVIQAKATPVRHQVLNTNKLLASKFTCQYSLFGFEYPTKGLLEQRSACGGT